MAMTRGRIMPAGPIVAIVFGSVAVVALRSASEFWYRAFYSMTAVSLMLATIAALWHSNIDRDFWFGFASFGWFTFISLLGLHGEAVKKPEAELAYNADPKLIGTNILLELVPILRKATKAPFEIDRITRCTFGVVALLAVIAVATCGGFIAVVLRRSNRRFKQNVTSTYRSNTVVFASIAFAIAVVSLFLGLVPTIMRIETTPRPAIRYFPSSSIDEIAGLTNDEVDMYTGILQAMRERPIFEVDRGSVDSATIRILIVTSYKHPICVRIKKRVSGADLRVVAVDGRFHSPGRIAIDSKVRLDDSDWKKLTKMLDELHDWNIDSKTGLPTKNISYDDSYLLEIVRGGRYQVVSLLDPDPPFMRLLRFSLELSGLQLSRLMIQDDRKD
jgi:hypothetical protein